jgi:hypothetical protein
MNEAMIRPPGPWKCDAIIHMSKGERLTRSPPHETIFVFGVAYALVDIWRRSYKPPPASVVLDIDDTLDVVHGHQKLSEWNAHYDK